MALLDGTVDDAARAHGTSVLGVMIAADNDRGCVGIAPAATASVVSPGAGTVAAAIVRALGVLGPGDVLLVEMTVNRSVDVRGPVEVLDAEFDAIQLATSMGITVVEPAGDHSFTLNAATNPSGTRSLDRDSPDFRDSGALVVAAAFSSVPHSRWSGSAFGNRVDCYA